MHESVHRYRHNHTQLRCTARIVQIMNSRCMCLHCPAGNKLFYVHPHQRLVNHDPFWVKIRKKIKCTLWWFDRISKIRKTNEEYPVMHDHTSLLFVLSKMEIRYFASRGRLMAWHAWHHEHEKVLLLNKNGKRYALIKYCKNECLLNARLRSRKQFYSNPFISHFPSSSYNTSLLVHCTVFVMKSTRFPSSSQLSN